MEVYLLNYLLDTHLRVNPPDPVEVVASVDGTMLRAAIEWPAIEDVLHADHVGHADEASVRDVIHMNRRRIELAIKAHLFAHGVPLERRVVITPDELHLTGTVERTGPPPGIGTRERCDPPA